MVVVDLDGFKNVNDTLGHAAGDELLQVAAQRLLGCVRDGDVAARLGGDEFAVMICSVDRDDAVAIAGRIVEVLHEPFTVGGHHISVGASVGIAHGGSPGSPDGLLRDADIAMYVAKRTGKGRVEVFEPEMRVKASHRTALQQELALAVERGEIDVAYQPVIDLSTAAAVDAGGPGAVAAARTAARARGRVHRAGRGVGRDQQDRPRGAAPRLPGRRALAARDRVRRAWASP